MRWGGVRQWRAMRAMCARATGPALPADAVGEAHGSRVSPPGAWAAWAGHGPAQA